MLTFLLFFGRVSLTSSFILLNLFSLLLHDSIQHFSHGQTGFLLKTDFFILPLSYPFLFLYMPISYKKRSLKALLFVSQPQTKPSGPKKGIKVIEASGNNTQVYCLQQPNEDVMNFFKDTIPATFSGFPLLWKENVLISNFFQCCQFNNRLLFKYRKISTKICSLNIMHLKRLT